MQFLCNPLELKRIEYHYVCEKTKKNAETADSDFKLQKKFEKKFTLIKIRLVGVPE